MALNIHVGAHKTATTHLQQTIRGLVGPMRDAGIHYLDGRQLRRGWERLDAQLDDKSGNARWRNLWRRRFDLVTDTWPQLLVSEENLLGTVRREMLLGANGVYPQALPRMTRLMEMMRDRPAVLFLSVRDPLQFLVSAFAMQVEAGNVLEFEDYLDGFDPAALSWSGLAARLLSVPGVAGLVAWRFEDYPALRPLLLDRLLVPGIAVDAPNPPPALVGMSQAAHDEIRRRIEADPDADRAALASEIKAMFPRGKGHARLEPVSDAAAARVRAAYRDDLESLARMPGVELLRAPGLPQHA